MRYFKQKSRKKNIGGIKGKIIAGFGFADAK